MSATSRRNKKKAGKPYSQTKPQVFHDDLPITILPDDSRKPMFGSFLHDFPAMSDIPERFKQDKNPFVKAQRQWFFGGLRASRLINKSGVDRHLALRYLACLQCSFAPSSEHKSASVAYLMAMWFDLVEE